MVMGTCNGVEESQFWCCTYFSLNHIRPTVSLGGTYITQEGLWALHV